MPRLKVVAMSFALAGMLAALSAAEGQSPTGVNSSTFGLGNGKGQVNSEYGKVRVHNKDGSVKEVDNPETYKVDESKGEYKRPHYGIDIPSKDASGRVRRLPFKAGVYGVVVPTPKAKWGTISVKLPDGRVVQYLHTSARTVPIGSFVTPDTVLGYTGNKAPAGKKLPIHLHVQVLNPDWTTPRNLKDGDPNIVIPKNQTLPEKLPSWFSKLSQQNAKKYKKEWSSNGKWTAFEGALPKGSKPPGGKAPFHQKITFDDSAAKAKPQKNEGPKRWAAEIVGYNGKITRIGVYNSYDEAQKASLKWSKANPKDLRLTREIELGGGKAHDGAKLVFDDKAKKPPASSLKGSKSASKPAARGVPQKPRTSSKLTVKKAPRGKSPLTAKQRPGSKSKATTVRARTAPKSAASRTSTVNRRPAVRKPAGGKGSSVRSNPSRTGGRGVAGKGPDKGVKIRSNQSVHRSAVRANPVNRRTATRPAVRRTVNSRPGANSTVRRSTPAARPTFRQPATRSTPARRSGGSAYARPTTANRSTYRRPAASIPYRPPAVSSNTYRRSSPVTVRRPTFRNPSAGSSYRTPSRSAIYRRPAVASSYRAPAVRSSFSRPSFSRPAVRSSFSRPSVSRPAVRSSFSRPSFTPRRSFGVRSFRR